MEFVGFGEVWSELKAHGVVERRRDERSLVLGIDLGIDPARQPVTVLIGPAPPSDTGPGAAPNKAGAPPLHVPCDSERIATALEAALHKLHLASLHVIPVGRWREVFDVISFGLAAHEAWQEIDSQASLQQNTRDALICGPRDLHMLREMVRVLLAEGEADAGQALTIVATGQLLVVRVEPKRPIEITVGSAKVAEQIRDAASHFLTGGSDSARSDRHA